MGKKKIIIFIVAALGIIGLAHAVDRTAPDIQNVAPPSCVSVSTSTWTAVPATASVMTVGKGGQILFSPASNSANFGVVLSSVTSVSVATTTAIMEIAPGESYFIENSANIYTFAVSYHTSAQNLCQQQIKLDYP